MIGIGLIGTGAIGGWHVDGVRDSGCGEVLSVYSRNFDSVQNFARTWNIDHPAQSLEEMLRRPEIDAVIISTPPDTHLELAQAAIAAGKHVLCEKPLTRTADEAVAMVDAAERKGVHLACASGRSRYEQEPSSAHLMIEGGELGDVYHVRHTYWRILGRPGHHMYPGVQWWMDRKQSGGGTLIDNGVYMIDVALWMLGFPRIISVTAQMRQATEVPPPPGMFQDVEDHAVVFIQCEDGKSAFIENSWVSNMTQMNGLSMDIHGTKAGLKMGPQPLTKISGREPGEREYTLGREYAPKRPVEELIIDNELHDQTLNMTSHARAVTMQFVLSLEAGRAPMTSGRESVEIMRVIDAAYQSAEQGGSIALESLDTSRTS